MGDNTPKPSVWLDNKIKSKKNVVEEEKKPTKLDLRPRWMRQYQDKNLKEDFESEPSNIEDIANDIALKSDIMGRVLQGVSMTSRFKTANEPTGEQPEKEKAVEFDPVKETPLNADEMGNARNVSVDPLTQDSSEREDAKMHYPDGKERIAVPEKELTIQGKNKLILTYQEAQKIIEQMLPGITIEWK